MTCSSSSPEQTEFITVQWHSYVSLRPGACRNQGKTKSVITFDQTFTAILEYHKKPVVHKPVFICHVRVVPRVRRTH